MSPPQTGVTIAPSWREQAVSSVVQGIYARHPGLAERFGERGVTKCGEDIRHYLDYLDGALMAGEAALFTNYAHWLKGVLKSRGVPIAHLVESFELLASFLSAHLPAAQAQPMSMILGAAQATLARDDLPSPYLFARLPALPDAMRYMEAALRGNNKESLGLMHGAMQAGVTLTEASVRLIQPAMIEIGRLWQENRITVAQEHLTTAISQNVMARAYMQADFAQPVGRKAMFAGVAGNHHSLGLRMLSDAFETQGWDVVFLGADVPVADLIRQVDADRPDLLCLSLSLPSHLAQTRETVERLRAELGNRCPTIWVGGQVTLMRDRVWHSVKADGWASDALHALEQIAV